MLVKHDNKSMTVLKSMLFYCGTDFTPKSVKIHNKYTFIPIANTKRNFYEWEPLNICQQFRVRAHDNSSKSVRVRVTTKQTIDLFAAN